MKVALLSAAVNGDNAGDAFIEDSVRRLILAERFERFHLVQPLTDAEITSINQNDCAVICGTNLYQSAFACNLNLDVLRRITVPIIPIGIGSSAPIGRIPVMNRESVEVVRAIHTSCNVSSVRDIASLSFLNSIGIKNVRLTGCPVLFHGLEPPQYRIDGTMSVTVRARLLHIGASFYRKEAETLNFLCAKYRPRLVIQSPYDIQLAEELASRYGLEIVQDASWQVKPYLSAIENTSVCAGFRLHFGMLALAYGRPSVFVAHDSRVAEFCRLMGLRSLDMRTYKIEELSRAIDSARFDEQTFLPRWLSLAGEMIDFLRANDLPCALSLPPLKRTRSVFGFRSSQPLAISVAILRERMRPWFLVRLTSKLKELWRMLKLRTRSHPNPR